MKHLNVQGDYRETGKGLGQFQKGVGRVLDTITDRQREFAHKCASAVEKHAPGLVEEVRAAARAAKWDYDELLWIAFAPDFEGACGVFAVSGEWTKDGRPLFGRNHDWLMSIVPYTAVLEANPTGNMKNLQVIIEPGMSCGGINEAGLAVGVTMAPRSTITVQPGVAANAATRWILDHFATTDEAVKYLKKIPHMAGYTLLMADAKGGMARAELSPDRTSVGKAEEGLIVASTHFLCEEMKQYEDLSIDFPWSYERVQRITNWFNERKGTITIKDAKEILGTHEIGICDHWQEGAAAAGTTWSWAASLGITSLSISMGPPCENEYQEIRLS
jgi:predicted choloylglycine hydrolase